MLYSMTMRGGLATVFILAAVLMLVVASIKSQTASAQEDGGNLDITHLMQNPSSPWGDYGDIQIIMELTPPAGYSFVFETADETTAFLDAGDQTASVYFRLVGNRGDCQTGIRPERAAALSEPNIHSGGPESAFANAGFRDKTDGSLSVSSHRTKFWEILDKYVCAAVAVKSDSPSAELMYSHLVSNQKITFGNIVKPLTYNPEILSASRPTIPFLLDDIFLTMDRSEIDLIIAIYNQLPENDNYQDNAANYWKYKLIASRSECPQVASSTDQGSGFMSFPEIYAWGHPQSNTSPSRHLTATLAENPADVKGKYLCLQTKLKDQPDEYSYYSSIAIDWVNGQLPTTPSSGWNQLTREEKQAFNPYNCINKEQIDENDGWCLDGHRQVVANAGDKTGADNDGATEGASVNKTILIIGGAILAAIVLVGLLLVRRAKRSS